MPKNPSPTSSKAQHQVPINLQIPVLPHTPVPLYAIMHRLPGDQPAREHQLQLAGAPQITPRDEERVPALEGPGHARDVGAHRVRHQHVGGARGVHQQQLRALGREREHGAVVGRLVHRGGEAKVYGVVRVQPPGGGGVGDAEVRREQRVRLHAVLGRVDVAQPAVVRDVREGEGVRDVGRLERGGWSEKEEEEEYEGHFGAEGLVGGVYGRSWGVL